MSVITPIEFMKFCISQGFEFVMVDDDKIINKDNVDELDTLMEKEESIPLDMRKTKCNREI